MKNIKDKIIKNKNLLFLTIIVGLIVHLPLLTKDILSADIILNNTYYSGYSWEVSLGRFGLFLIGLLKNYIVIPHIEIFLSLILVSFISIELIDLFKIKNKLLQILTCIILVVCPNISSTLLFNYCSLPYTYSFFASVTAIYTLIKANNKYIKIILPIILLVSALSMYQAYLPVSITLLVLYYLKELLNNEFKYKEALKNILIIVISIILYFILMKLSQKVLNINMSNYTNASSFGIKNIINMPKQILLTYQVFIDYFFTNKILTNTNLYNNIINGLLLITVLLNIIYITIKNKLKIQNILLIIFLVLTLPIYINCILLIMPSATMQLLMASAYILLIPFLFSIQDNKIYKIISIILISILIRNYTIQDNATYKSLEIKHNKILNISNDLVKSIKDLGYNKEVMIIGNINENEFYNYNTELEISNINKLTYGFIIDLPFFWDEFNNNKNGWTRYLYQYTGTNINYVSKDKYDEILNSKEIKSLEAYPSKKSIKLIDDVIVIKL